MSGIDFSFLNGSFDFNSMKQQFDIAYDPFKFNKQEFSNLLSSVDGMQSYSAETGWAGYPERTKDTAGEYAWGRGIDDNYVFQTTEEIPDVEDGIISEEESKLGIQQGSWDRDNPTGGSVEEVSNNVVNFLKYLFSDGKVAEEFDTDGDGQFTIDKDAKAFFKPGGLASLDGDASTFSSEDLNKKLEGEFDAINQEIKASNPGEENQTQDNQ